MNVTDILKRSRVPLREAGQHHHVREGWVGTDCPYCSANSGRFRLGFRVMGGAASCWTCGKHPFYRALADVTREEITTLFDLIPRSTLPQFDEKRQRADRVKVPEGVGPLLKAHKDYLHKRGFDPDEISEVWGVGGIGIASRLSWRLYIPIHHEQTLVSWTTRSIARNAQNRVLRYVNASPSEETMSVKETLYGADNAISSVCVCEGPVDVWAVGRGAVALMGLNYTRAQVMMLASYVRRIVCLDSASEAQRVAHRLCDELEAFPGETINVVLSGKDAAETSRKEVKRLRAMMM